MTIVAITLETVRQAAQRLANARNDLNATAAHMNAEIKAAIGPVVEKYRVTLDQYAATEADAHLALKDLVEAMPELFVKPRSFTVDGVSCGYRKAQDSLDWDDDQVVINKIAEVFPELYDVLVRVIKSLVVDGISTLTEEQRKLIGVRTVPGADVAYVKIGDNDVEKIAKLVVADATARQGEEEKTTQKKGKAALKAAA